MKSRKSESSRRDAPPGGSDVATRLLSAEEIAAIKLSLNEESSAPDSSVDTSDMPEITDWAGAIRGFPKPFRRQISVLLDPDVYAWIRTLQAPPDKRINRILRQHLRAELRKEAEGAQS